MHPTHCNIRATAQNQWHYHHEQPREQVDGYHDPVICVDFSDTINQLLEECKKRKFDGKDCSPSEAEHRVKCCPSGGENFLNLIRAYFRPKGRIVLYGGHQKKNAGFLVNNSSCCDETHDPYQHYIVV